MLDLKLSAKCLQHGYVTGSYYHSEPSMGRKVIGSVIKAKIMGLLTPGMVTLMAK